ncbi:CRISPR-associated protein Cas4 [Caenispirillum bisanense]|uniref:CRISPR-associated protein Cas4 n=1 Tax=Caenispirillum bisanense TaxID=414052 RepID=UPI0031D78ECC
MEEDDDDIDLLPLSALQHLVFCPRQCVLIHGERQWAENRLTAEGRVLHDRVDTPEEEVRGGLRIARAVPLASRRLGLTGRADVVEFYRDPAAPDAPWRPLPVEYKRGRHKDHDADRVQLCAQALCLEDMLGLPVPEGALFYGQPRRRQRVPFDAALRARTEDLAAELRRLLRAPALPPPLVDDPRCRSCSLVDICRPAVAGRSAARWLDRALGRLLADDAGTAEEDDGP